MLAFGVCIGSEDRYASIAQPALSALSAADSVVIVRRGVRSIFEGYNEILDEAQRIDGLESLVLLHEDVELRQRDLLERLRTVFADPTVGIVGVVGARDVRSLAWWEGERAGRASWNGLIEDGNPQVDDFGFDNTDVEAVDGMFMALSPWVVQHVRFDAQRFTGFNGYDVDFCFEVRKRGRRVVVAPIDLHHHDRRAGFPHRMGWRRTDIRWRAKWGFIRRSSVAPRLMSLTMNSKRANLVSRLRRVIAGGPPT